MRQHASLNPQMLCGVCGTPSASFMKTCSSCGAALQAMPRQALPASQGQAARSLNTSTPLMAVNVSNIGFASPQHQRPPSAAPPQKMEAASSVADIAMRVEGLPARLRPVDGRFTEEQFLELRSLVAEAGKYSEEISTSVISLQDQISRKRRDVDRLQLLLASPSMEGDEQLQRRQQAAMPKPSDLIDPPQVVEYKHLVSQLEALRNERTQMQTDLVALRTLVAELSRVPQAVETSYAAGGAGGRRRQLIDPQMEGLVTSPTASWNIGKTSVTNSEQRDLINCLQYLTTDDAKPLQQGTLHFLRVLARRLVLPLPNGTRPEIGITVGEVLRELRRGQDLADEALLPMPTAETTLTERIVSLFLANNPFSYGELQKLLAKFEGREDELYKLLQKEYGDMTQKLEEEQQQRYQNPEDDPLWSPAQPSSFRQSQLAKLGTSQINPINKSVSIDQREMHARCVIMYKKYNPAKANSRDFNELLKKYTPEVVLAALVEKYGPEPTLNERRQLVKEMFDANAAASPATQQAAPVTPPSGPAPPTAAALASLNSSRN